VCDINGMDDGRMDAHFPIYWLDGEGKECGLLKKENPLNWPRI
jgi:hypothetical protein